MLRIAICDDDLNFSNYFMKVIMEKFTKEDIDCRVVCFESGEALFEAGEAFDLYYLDVEISKASGLELAGKIRREVGRKPEIVFVTAHDNVVYDVFEYEAIGFIRKANLTEDVDKAMSNILRKMRRQNYQYEIKSEGSIIYKNVEEMIYVEVYSHKLILHCIDGDYPVWGSLDELEEKLSRADFIRTHRCYLVNPRFIKKFERQLVILETPELIKIPFSKHKATEVKEKYWDYMMNL